MYHIDVETYHLKYNPVPPVTIGTRPLLRISLVACLASSKNCPTEYSSKEHHVKLSIGE